MIRGPRTQGQAQDAPSTVVPGAGGLRPGRALCRRRRGRAGGGARAAGGYGSAPGSRLPAPALGPAPVTAGHARLLRPAPAAPWPRPACSSASAPPTPASAPWPASPSSSSGRWSTDSRGPRPWGGSQVPRGARGSLGPGSGRADAGARLRGGAGGCSAGSSRAALPGGAGGVFTQNWPWAEQAPRGPGLLDILGWPQGLNARPRRRRPVCVICTSPGAPGLARPSSTLGPVTASSLHARCSRHLLRATRCEDPAVFTHTHLCWGIRAPSLGTG